MYRKIGLIVIICVIVTMVFAGCGGVSNNPVASSSESTLTIKDSIVDSLVRVNTSQWALVGTSGYQQYLETDTGFNWGGYNPAKTSNSIVVDEYYSGRLQFYATANLTGSYVYTIFDEDTGTTPTEAVNMTSGSFTVNFGLESTDTGVTQQIRLMIRDGSGNWYLSDAKTISQTSSGSGTDYNFAVSGITWSTVDATNAGHMNDMDRGCTTITMSTASSVDLSQVTGTGVYVETPTASVTGQVLILYQITLSKS